MSGSEFVLVLVPQENIRTHSPEGKLPEIVAVDAGAYEVIADIHDHQIKMSREVYEQVEVVDP